MVERERKSIDEEQQPLLSKHTKKEETHGLLLLLLSTVTSVGMSLFIKLCGDSIPSSEIVVMQTIIEVIFVLVGCVSKGINPFGPPEIRHWLVLFGVIGGLQLVLGVYCAQRMPLADFTGIYILFC